MHVHLSSGHISIETGPSHHLQPYFVCAISEWFAKVEIAYLRASHY